MGQPAFKPKYGHQWIWIAMLIYEVDKLNEVWLLSKTAHLIKGTACAPSVWMCTTPLVQYIPLQHPNIAFFCLFMSNKKQDMKENTQWHHHCHKRMWQLYVVEMWKVGMKSVIYQFVHQYISSGNKSSDTVLNWTWGWTQRNLYTRRSNATLIARVSFKIF